MNRQNVRTRFGEIRQVAIWILDHQVNIQNRVSLPGKAAQGSDDQWPESDVGDEVPVHNINMDDLGSTVEHFFDLSAQPVKISSENRRHDLDWIHEKFFLIWLSCPSVNPHPACSGERSEPCPRSG